jgi:hypothetical protein
MKQVNTTRIGRKWELWALEYLFPGAVLMTNKSRNAPFDILDGEARINVKSSHIYTKKHGKYFDFILEDTHTDCDYFCCIGYRYKNDKDPVKVWLIPSSLLLDRRRVNIGPNHSGQWKDFERPFESRKAHPVAHFEHQTEVHPVEIAL